jgi:hypothetical protein
MFSYSKSKGACFDQVIPFVPITRMTSDIVGLFAGLSLEGTALIERKDANKDFYGSAIPARDILGGRVPPPEVASRLYEIIEAAEGLDEIRTARRGICPNFNRRASPGPSWESDCLRCRGKLEAEQVSRTTVLTTVMLVPIPFYCICIFSGVLRSDWRRRWTYHIP